MSATPIAWRRQELTDTVDVMAYLQTDLLAATTWLRENGEAIAKADGCTPRVWMGHYDRPEAMRLRLSIQCPDRKALARVTRILMAGAGFGGVSKELSSSCEVVRRFGRVEVAAWIAREKVCTPLTGRQSGWDCAPFLDEPLAEAAG